MVVKNVRRFKMEKVKYSFGIGLRKTIKNSAVLLVPFFLALSANVPVEYAWLTGPVVYLLKNYYSNK